jgi:hypothetical protein
VVALLDVGVKIAQSEPSDLDPSRCEAFAQRLGEIGAPADVIASASRIADPPLAELVVNEQVALRDVLSACASGDGSVAPAVANLRVVNKYIADRRAAVEEAAR